MDIYTDVTIGSDVSLYSVIRIHYTDRTRDFITIQLDKEHFIHLHPGSARIVAQSILLAAQNAEDRNKQ